MNDLFIYPADVAFTKMTLADWTDMLNKVKPPMADAKLQKRLRYIFCPSAGLLAYRLAIS